MTGDASESVSVGVYVVTVGGVPVLVTPDQTLAIKERDLHEGADMRVVRFVAGGGD